MSFELPVIGANGGAGARPGANGYGSHGAPPPPSAPAHVRAHQSGGRLLDSHGRVIRELRLSVTDRCNFRCVYCMDPDFRYMPKRELLSLDEYVQLVRVCVGLGITKVRITGGEPTLYPQVTELIERLGKMMGDAGGRDTSGDASLEPVSPGLRPGVDEHGVTEGDLHATPRQSRGLTGKILHTGLRDLAMTTNGSLLEKMPLERWRKAGLRRLTFSMDSLRPDRAARITRANVSPDQIVRGIRMAKAAGLGPIKVNAVMMRGINDDEAADFADFALREGVEVRLIEYMPLDSSRAWRREDVVSAREMLEAIRKRHEIEPDGEDEVSTTSRNYRFVSERGREGGDGEGHSEGARIGVIAPVTEPFCGACNRLRITADGKIRPCLFSLQEWDVREVMRGTANTPPGDDSIVGGFIQDAVWQKQKGHGIGDEHFVQPERTMSAIGG